MLRTNKFIVAVIALILCASAFSVLQSAWAQNLNTKQADKDENYRRPEPTKPLKPTIPQANRNQSDKVFLEFADSLYRPSNILEEYQIVKGSVKFRHGGMWMFCDSAYYYPNQNSLIAFGHVEMTQGDTLFVYADKLNYDGNSKNAILTKGRSRSNVLLKNRNVSLTTDSLTYNLTSRIGKYETGGKLTDQVNDLTSQYGEYSTSTKIARFQWDVVLINRRDKYRLTTEELEYNTRTHIADLQSRTLIEGATDTIVASSGTYNTLTDHAELTSRSLIKHRDDKNNLITLEGDLITYDKLSRISRAFSTTTPMVITDTARKVTLIGGYGEYNDVTQVAFATKYPLLIEYSRPDTIFLRADTIMSFIEQFTPMTINTRIDSVEVAADELDEEPIEGELRILKKIGVKVNDTIYGEPKDVHLALGIHNGRFFNSQIQGIADSLIFREQDSMLYMIKKPIVWSGERQVYGNRINVHFNDSTSDWAELPEYGMLAEHIEEDFYQQLTGAYMMAYFEDQNLKRLEVEGSVKAILLPQENDSSYNKLVHAESSFLTIDMDGKDLRHLKMWPEVSGSVVPLFNIKRDQKRLDSFYWFDDLRPRRIWYGNWLRWNDELGELPEGMEQYFNSPPLFRNVSPYKKKN